VSVRASTRIVIAAMMRPRKPPANALVIGRGLLVAESGVARCTTCTPPVWKASATSSRRSCRSSASRSGPGASWFTRARAAAVASSTAARAERARKSRYPAAKALAIRAARAASASRTVIETMLELRSIAVVTRPTSAAGGSESRSDRRTPSAIGSSVMSSTPVLSWRSGSGEKSLVPRSASTWRCWSSRTFAVAS
jgi:hypothetical protein